MSKKNIHKHDLNTGMWLVGLGFLFLTHTIWPGILILIGLTILIDTLYHPAVEAKTEQSDFVYNPESVEKNQNVAQEPQPPSAPESPIAEIQPSPIWHDTTILPNRCPRCGAPIKTDEVHWTSVRSANCPYCNGSLDV